MATSSYPSVLSVFPNDLRIDLVLGKELKTFLTLKNITSKLICFKIKTTNPKRYVVVPTSGIIPIDTTVNIEIRTVQSFIEVPNDEKQLIDKFQIQAMTLEEAIESNKIPGLWIEKESLAKTTGLAHYWQTVLKCHLVPNYDSNTSESVASFASTESERQPVVKPLPSQPKESEATVVEKLQIPESKAIEKPLSPVVAPTIPTSSPSVASSSPAIPEFPPGYVELIKKAQQYEKLLTQVVKLTAEVDRLSEVNKQLLNKNTDMASKIRTLQNQLPKSDSSKPPTLDEKDKVALFEKDDDKQYSNIQLWHVIVIALICLIIGRIL